MMNVSSDVKNVHRAVWIVSHILSVSFGRKINRGWLRKRSKGLGSGGASDVSVGRDRHRSGTLCRLVRDSVAVENCASRRN